jgi:hypothetical protein
MEPAMIRDSRFHVCTPKPSNLAEWRLQRHVKRFLERTALSARDESRVHAPAADGAPMSGGVEGHAVCATTPPDLSRLDSCRGAGIESGPLTNSTRGQPPPDAVPGPRGFIPKREPWQDNLNAARGIVYGAICGALMWLTIYLLWPGK